MEDISKRVNTFLEGRNPLEHIVNIECGFDEDAVSIIYKDSNGVKRIRKEDFKPFVWAKNSVCIRMCNGDRKQLIKEMKYYGINVKALATHIDEKPSDERLEKGYKFIFYATKKMSNQRFHDFFNKVGTPIYKKKKKNEEEINDDKEFLAVTPIEQFMISSGMRLFKGYEGYDELKRFLWDIETTGLNPEVDVLDQIGIRTNKGFEKILTVEGTTKEEKMKNEIETIDEFLKILANEKSDTVCGHNSENFDWNFLMVRAQKHGTTIEELSSKYFYHPIHKKNKESVLKLGGEVEYFKPTILWGTTILDSMHAVRRAQASDSSIKKANLKYVTKYLEINKENRVYVKGSQIGEIWRETNNVYAFNDTNGDYYKVSDIKPLKDGYVLTSGKYIVERYLLDDIWETDKVELALNEANFLISKILPTSFQRACTMGTAGIWKLIMVAWCYENNLAIPSFGQSKSFTGGLSRLLKVGYVDRIVKLDYNSLYPSIMLTWWVENGLDITNSMLHMLDYVLTNRELYKGKKADCGAKAKKLKKFIEANKDTLTIEQLREYKNEMNQANADKNSNDKKQLPLKILGNSVFGSFGAPSIFPFGNTQSAEFVTCVGRMCLRLMINHFKKLGYEPIVGDSVLGDTPLFIKYKGTNLIDIKPISEIVNEKQINIDALGREYDYSEKPYQVLCRSGWSDIQYVYRHKTNKNIYTVSEGEMSVDVTEDHSLFDKDNNEIKPRDINEKTELEYYTKSIDSNDVKQYACPLEIKITAINIKKYKFDRIPTKLMNLDKAQTSMLLEALGEDFIPNNKTCKAQILYLKNKCVDYKNYESR